MSKNSISTFIGNLKKSKTEEDVKNVFAKHFNIDYDTSDNIDLYTPQVLFEFKYDKNLSNLRHLAAVLAQNLYYVRRLKYGITEKSIPPILCLAARDYAVITLTSDWKSFYTSDAYDWDVAPSKPDHLLIDTLFQSPTLRSIKIYELNEIQTPIFVDLLDKRLTGQGELILGDKKIITEANFEEVYKYWNEVFGESVRNGFKSSRYFVNDIQVGRTHVIASEGKVLFQLDQGEYKGKKILTKDYDHFWSLYEKVSDANAIRGILAKADRLTDDVARRRHGEFYTPLNFSLKALDYLEQSFGKNWWRTGEYRLWDMAAGTGNLEYHLPADAYPYCYMSTLDREDIEHCKKLFHGATLFQYDYLNEDIGNVFDYGDNTTTEVFNFEDSKTWKLPEKLRIDLANPQLKWIILINPPFATAQKGGTKGANKSGVADTKLRKVMHQHNLGEVSRELFSQFLFRIKKEFHSKTVWLGLFSKLGYINATNDFKLRESIFRFKFERGMMFSSVHFDGTSRASPFPVGFLLWNLSVDTLLEQQKIILDVFDENVQKIERKSIHTKNKALFLSKWVSRPKGVIKYPPFSSAIMVKHNGVDVRDRISDGFLGALMCAGNDVQHQNMTALLSGPYVSAGSHSIIAENFENSLVVHAVRRLPKATWHNDRDQFMAPQKALPKEFIVDCVLWSLFSNSNQTAALRDIVYLNSNYQIQNHFFPFTLTHIKNWEIQDNDLRLQIATAENRFVANWIAQTELSTEAKILLNAASRVYQLYFSNLSQLRMNKFKIATWDAGWWQIRNALVDGLLGDVELKAVQLAHQRLKDKLIPQVYNLGFLEHYVYI